MIRHNDQHQELIWHSETVNPLSTLTFDNIINRKLINQLSIVIRECISRMHLVIITDNDNYQSINQ